MAARAGVSRQLVGAVEAGRHLPRVDAALALADALGVAAEELFNDERPTPAGVVGPAPPSGTPVRLGRVGDRLVCAPAPSAGEWWEPADAVLHPDGPELFPGARPGSVAVGCDPALGLAAALGSSRGAPRLLALATSTASAIEALAAGRAHAAVAHGPEGRFPTPPVGMRLHRWHVARWQVGLAAPAGLASGWAQEALAGRRRVVQREAGAGSQATFERCVEAADGRIPDGPLVAGHLEAARRALTDGLAAVTIEPAARAFGLAFHPLEQHGAQLWVPDQWHLEPGVVALADLLVSPALQRHLEAVGGYDLAECGDPVPA